jgi:hypothetical protein
MDFFPRFVYFLTLFSLHIVELSTQRALFFVIQSNGGTMFITGNSTAFLLTD